MYACGGGGGGGRVCEGCLVKSQVVRLAPWERLGGCFQMGDRGGG